MTDYNTILASLIIWAKIHSDDQKMMFCTQQAAQLITPEHFAELEYAASVLDRLRARTFRSNHSLLEAARHYMELMELSEIFNGMVLLSIRDCSRMADILGVGGP